MMASAISQDPIGGPAHQRADIPARRDGCGLGAAGLRRGHDDAVFEALAELADCEDGGTGGLGRAVALDLGRSAALQLYAHLGPTRGRRTSSAYRRRRGWSPPQQAGRSSALPVAGVRAQAARERGTGTSGDGSGGAGGGGGLSGVSRFQVAAGRSGPRGPDRPPAAVCLRGGSWNNNAENQRPGARNRNRRQSERQQRFSRVEHAPPPEPPRSRPRRARTGASRAGHDEPAPPEEGGGVTAGARPGP